MLKYHDFYYKNLDGNGIKRVVWYIKDELYRDLWYLPKKLTNK